MNDEEPDEALAKVAVPVNVKKLVEEPRVPARLAEDCVRLPRCSELRLAVLFHSIW